jgi:hypothetical protein
VRPEGLGKLNISFTSSTPDLPACSIVPQPLRYRVPSTLGGTKWKRNYMWGHANKKRSVPVANTTHIYMTQRVNAGQLVAMATRN